MKAAEITDPALRAVALRYEAETGATIDGTIPVGAREAQIELVLILMGYPVDRSFPKAVVGLSKDDSSGS